MARMVKKKRWPIVAAIAVAVGTFVATGLVTSGLLILAVGMAMNLMDSAGLRDELAPWVTDVFVVGVNSFSVLAALVVTRWIYKDARRWKTVAIDDLHCAECDYDLTGNESGVCPECGVPIESVESSG